jgi:hypothetical protein
MARRLNNALELLAEKAIWIQSVKPDTLVSRARIMRLVVPGLPSSELPVY